MSQGGDAGVPHVLLGSAKIAQGNESASEAGWNEVMKGVAEQVWAALPKRKESETSR